MRLVTEPQSRWRDDKGQALVEFALCAVLFLTVLFGIMNFGLAVHQYHFVDYAARAATRYAIVRGASSPKPATASDIQAFVVGLGLEHAKVTTTWKPDNAAGSIVQVSVQYDFTPLTPLVPSAVLPLTSTSQMVISQ